MTDIFFSYRSNDRERVRHVRDAFAALGFEVFWDQQVPAGVDWDAWIRRHLAQAKCAIVFWSATSVTSDNVRHEATVAKQQNKLIPVILEQLTIEQFPIGLYAQQAANLIDWNGDFDAPEWRKLRREVEAKLTPSWIRQSIDELEAELIAERARRERAERRDEVFQAQIVKEAQAQQDLRRERDKAVEDVAALRSAVQELSRALSESDKKAKQRLAQTNVERQMLERQRDEAVARATEAERDLLNIKTQPQIRPRGLLRRMTRAGDGTRAVAIFFVWLPTLLLIAALTYINVNMGVWRYMRAAIETALSRKEFETEKSDNAHQLPAENAGQPGDRTPVRESFVLMNDMEATGKSTVLYVTNSSGDCKQRCAQSITCSVFSYNKHNTFCYLYQTATFKPNPAYDSGRRNTRRPIP
jgi:hypothetical protein